MSNPHTPGPWNLHSPDEGDPKTGDGSFCITAKITGAEDDSEMVIANAEPRDWHETPANARLIAAAPDLLECLKWAATFAEGTRDQQCCGDDLDNPTFNRWIEGCNQAIAKAEGGHDWYARVSDAGDNFVSCNRCGAHKAEGGAK